jgi:hypothetical protein
MHTSTNVDVADMYAEKLLKWQTILWIQFRLLPVIEK